MYSEKDGVINARFSCKIKKERFSPQLYQGLKDFFNAVVTAETKDVIALKKV